MYDPVTRPYRPGQRPSSSGARPRRGWRGNPPATADEARERIIAAAMTCIDRHGADKTGLADVARELGVTRQTLYRHFASMDDLLVAVVRTAVGRYLDRLAAHVAQLSDPVEVVVEALAYTLEHLPDEGYMGLLFSSGRSGRFFAGVTSPDAVELARSFLEQTGVDWAATGYDRAALDELAEFLLRILLSLIVDAGTPRRDGAELRAFLRRWAGPAIVPSGAGHTRASTSSAPARRAGGHDRRR